MSLSFVRLRKTRFQQQIVKQNYLGENTRNEGELVQMNRDRNNMPGNTTKAGNVPIEALGYRSLACNSGNFLKGWHLIE